MTSWTANQFRTFRKLYIWWRDQLTIVGKLVFLLMICSLPTLADSGAVWAIVFMASSSILLVASATSFLYRPRLSFKVTCPKNWMRSECRVLRVEIMNQSRRPICDLQLDLIPKPETWEIMQSSSFAKVLHPGQAITVSIAVRALRRGLFQLPRLQATTLFPLHLVRRAVTYQLPRKALILPFYRELRSFDLAQSAPSLARGNNLTLQTVGLTGEYVGSREYQPGVPVRKWDYPSWARLGQPVVREFSAPRHPSAAVILDTFFPAQACENARPLPELEVILSLAAAITEALIERGNRIDLLVIGNRLATCHDRELGEDHQAILERLALAQPCCADELSDLREEIEQTPVTWELAIVLSHRWGEEQEQLFQAATRRHGLGKRIVVRTDERASDYARHDMLHCVTSSQVEAGLVDF